MALLFGDNDPDYTLLTGEKMRGGLATLLLARAPAMALTLAAGVPAVLAAWALLSPDQLLSREMTWDLLFNLAGAWHVVQGHTPHVDFHDPVGALNFLLTAIGFHLVGPSPHAFLVGSVIVATALFAAAAFTAWRRLPLLPAVLFVLFASLLALMPANIGDLPNAYSFAMSYNRYGWSALAVITLALFVPPRDGRSRMAFGAALDGALVGLLLLALFYLKVTYFMVGLAALALAVIACPAIRRHWQWWTVLGLLLVANVFAPYNRPYLEDLLEAADSGMMRDDLVLQANYFLVGGAEHAGYLALVGFATWLWWRGHAPLRLPLAAAFLVAAGLALLSQNSQSAGMPLGVVLVLLVYDAVRGRMVQAPRPEALVLLPALLLLPLLSVAAAAASIAGYHMRATGGQSLVAAEHTQLAGLAVPAEESGLLDAFAAGKRPTFALLNRARATRSRHELSPYEYLDTILEAATLLADPRFGRGSVALLDQVNPLPFMLGLPPLRGGNLWSGGGAPIRSVDEVLGGADHVLIPKFSTFSEWTDAAMVQYGPYLADHFRHREESRSWIIVSRRRTDPPEQLSAQPHEGR